MPETEDSISAMQLKLQYNIDVAVQDNAAQHCATLAANTISNTGKIAKMVYNPDFFGEDGGRNPHH